MRRARDKASEWLVLDPSLGVGLSVGGQCVSQWFQHTREVSCSPPPTGGCHSVTLAWGWAGQCSPTSRRPQQGPLTPSEQECAVGSTAPNVEASNPPGLSPQEPFPEISFFSYRPWAPCPGTLLLSSAAGQGRAIPVTPPPRGGREARARSLGPAPSKGNQMSGPRFSSAASELSFPALKCQGLRAGRASVVLGAH